jgi:hypothetical protein
MAETKRDITLDIQIRVSANTVSANKFRRDVELAIKKSLRGLPDTTYGDIQTVWVYDFTETDEDLGQEAKPCYQVGISGSRLKLGKNQTIIVEPHPYEWFGGRKQ